jgi:hypothetical protein
MPFFVEDDSPEPRPNPGSDAARAQGCICPVLDNNHGKWAPWPPDGWWMRPDCPLHRPATGEA